MKRNDFFDILKFFLAVAIVAIHAQLFGKGDGKFLVWPYLRLAVPLFFMMSGYFVFKKAQDEEDGFAAIKRFAVRNYKMYLFWCVVFSPYFLWMYGGVQGPLEFLLFVRRIFFTGLSKYWFILAAIEGVVIVFLLNKYTGRGLALILSAAVYVWACLKSSYWGLFSDCDSVCQVQSVIEKFIGWPQLSFPVSMIWISIGKEFAENRLRCMRNWRVAMPSLAIALACFWGEWFLVMQETGKFRCDAYLFALPTVVPLFGLLLNVELTNRYAGWFRTASVAIYMIHGVALLAVHVVLKYVLRVSDVYHIFEWIGAILLCLACMSGINALRNRQSMRIFRLLKYAW